MTGAQPPPPSQESERAQVVEEAIPSLGGPTYKDVKPKTYQVLEDQLPPEQTQAPGKPFLVSNGDLLAFIIFKVVRIRDFLKF